MVKWTCHLIVVVSVSGNLHPVVKRKLRDPPPNVRFLDLQLTCLQSLLLLQYVELQDYVVDLFLQLLHGSIFCCNLF